MSAAEIVRALFASSKGVSPLRIQKAQQLAQRSRVSWLQVLAAMTPAQRALVEG